MANLLAKEYKAWWVGPRTGSYDYHRLCTKSRAINTFKVSLRHPSSYTDTQIVPTFEMYYRWSDTSNSYGTSRTSTWTTSWDSNGGSSCNNCSCQGDCGSISNHGCWCYTGAGQNTGTGNCGLWNTSGYCNRQTCGNYCPCHGGNFRCSCASGYSSWSSTCSCDSVCTCNSVCSCNTVCTCNSVCTCVSVCTCNTTCRNCATDETNTAY